jgi:FKBP-type peptidyl-prolyl cis-trans isomerase FkpA
MLVAGVFIISCETTNPFNVGPAYDEVENLKIDRAKIVAFLDTAKIDSLYRIHDPSGVVIIVQKEGSGTRPTTNTVIYTDYIGSLMEGGTVFDTSYEDVAKENSIFVEGRKYNPLSFVLGSSSVIFGWEFGFRRLRPGSKSIMIIPSPYAYRDQESNNRIPANSILLFDIDFLGID